MNNAVWKNAKEEYPRVKATHYLTVCHLDGIYSYTFRYYDEDGDWEEIDEGHVVAFTETKAHEVMESLL